MHRSRFSLPRRQHQQRRVLTLAVAPLAAAAAAMLAGSDASAHVIVRNIKPAAGSSLRTQTAVPGTLAPANDSISAFPVTYPINGFQPWVVFGLTDENQNDFYSPKAAVPGSLYRSPPNQNTLMSPQPFNVVPNPARYFVGTLDAGGQATIIGYDDSEAINLFANGLEGVYQIDVSGAGGGEPKSLDVSDGLGQYITGIGNATPSVNGPVVSQSSLKGIWNNSILTTSDPTIEVPNLIGNPIFAHWQFVIRNSQTQRLQVNGKTYQGPQITMQNIGTAHDNTFVEVPLVATSIGGANSFPVLTPDFFGSDDWSDNPTAPTVWNFMGVNVNLGNNIHGADHTMNQTRFLFDTGAQVSVISNETAGLLGINTGGGNADPPDFTAEVQGVDGTQTVNGYYIDNLSIVTNGVDLDATNVPVLVLDLDDPMDGDGAVPGILGMNLFNDRDLIVNAKTGTGSYLAFSEFALPDPKWIANSGGNWGDNSKWFRGVPWQAGETANFTSTTTAPQTITVDSNNGQGPYVVGHINFDNANRYTLSGPGSLRLEELVGNASIQVTTGSHTIGVPLALASNATMTVIPAASILTINQDVSSTNNSGVTKTGQGTVEIKRMNGVGAVDVQAGKVKTLVASSGGAPARTSSIDDLTIAAAARFDLTNNNLVINGGSAGTANGSGIYNGVQGQVQRAYNFGGWDQPGLTTSMPDAVAGLTTIGVATGEQIRGLGATDTDTFGGQTIDGASVIAMYTYAGDANLDGTIDGGDYGVIDNFVQIPGAGGYANGDFNYDGVIDGGDYGIIDNNIQAQGAPFPTAGSADLSGVTAIPEPSACAFAVVAAAAFTARRRRRSMTP